MTDHTAIVREFITDDRSLTDHAAVIREALHQHAPFPTAYAALAALEQELTAYKSALSGTQVVRDEYKARAQRAEERVHELADELAEAKRERDAFKAARLDDVRLLDQRDEALVRAQAAELALDAATKALREIAQECEADSGDEWVESLADRARAALAATEDTA